MKMKTNNEQVDDEFKEKRIVTEREKARKYIMDKVNENIR
jgi:hypothetical protein